jgi:hypothetical protein
MMQNFVLTKRCPIAQVLSQLQAAVLKNNEKHRLPYFQLQALRHYKFVLNDANGWLVAF